MIKKQKVGAIVQARVGSKRLPKKVLKKFCGKTILSIILERLRLISKIDKIVVATTTKREDDLIIKEAVDSGVAFFRGDEDDVLRRYISAADENEIDIIVRVTADEPMVDYKIIDNMIASYVNGEYDYISTTIERTFPKGIDAEVFSLRLLKDIASQSDSSYHHEHVTTYIHENKECYRILNIFAPPRLEYPELVLTVDTPDDYERVGKLFEIVYKRNPRFTTDDVVAVINERPELVEKIAPDTIKRFLFRVDAHYDIGIGDVKTCISLAKAINKDIESEVVFLMKDYTLGNFLVEKAGFSVQKFGKNVAREEEINIILTFAKNFEPHFIIFEACPNDHYVIEKVKKNGFKIVCIDFGGEKTVYADIVVNWDVVRHQYEKNKYIPDQKILEGEKYVILSEEFNNGQKYELSDRRPENILITTGGTDFSNLTPRILDYFNDIEGRFNIDVIVGPGFENNREISEIAVKSKHNVTIHNNIKNNHPFYLKSNIAVTTGGLTSYEVSAAGVPTMMVSATGHQTPRVRYFGEKGMCANLGFHADLTRKNFVEMFNLLRNDANLRLKLHNNSVKTVDDYGVFRIAEEITSML
jgi:spore coat polysaccharide biosynthesis protein SpsF